MDHFLMFGELICRDLMFDNYCDVMSLSKMYQSIAIHLISGL